MISASVVLYNPDIEEVISVLNSLLENLVDLVYVIDNSPNDCSGKLLNKHNLIYIHGHGNIGYGAGHNIAIKKAIELKSDYHLVVNPDISFEVGTLSVLKEYMDQNYEVGLVMPRIINTKGETQMLCRLLPSPVDLIGRRFVPFENLIKKRNSKYEMHASGYDKIMDVPFLSGCFMFFRTSALEYVKGFSERYWMYCEDIDICRRVGKRYRTRYFPYVTAKHLHKKESFTNKKMLRAHINSAVKYFNYWGWIFDRNRKVINQHAESQFI